MSEQVMNAGLMQAAGDPLGTLAAGIAAGAGSDGGSQGLISSDVHLLRDDKMGAGAVKVARKVAAAYCKTDAAGDAREHAEAIISEWLQRGAEPLRGSLSLQLAECSFLPRTLLLTMAEDVAAVASPILEHSELLTEDDLLRIVDSAELGHRLAIAGRRYVPHLVSDALIDCAEEDVAIRLLRNEGSKLSEPSLHRVMDAFNKNDNVVDALTDRGRVPSSVADRLLILIAEPATAGAVEGAGAEPVSGPKERPHPLFGRLLAKPAPHREAVGGADAAQLADQIAGAGRLSPAFLLRALCDSRIATFEAGMARLSGLPVENVRRLLASGGEEPMEKLLRRVGVPVPLHPAFGDGIDALLLGRRGEHDKDIDADKITAIVMEIFKNDDTINTDEYKAVLARLYAALDKCAAGQTEAA